MSIVIQKSTRLSASLYLTIVDKKKLFDQYFWFSSIA